jgi:hypothetical protein
VQGLRLVREQPTLCGADAGVDEDHPVARVAVEERLDPAALLAVAAGEAPRGLAALHEALADEAVEAGRQVGPEDGGRPVEALQNQVGGRGHAAMPQVLR